MWAERAHISSMFRILHCSEMVDVSAIPLVLLVESRYSKRALFVASVECRARSAAVSGVHMPPALDQVSAGIAVALSPLADTR